MKRFLLPAATALALTTGLAACSESSTTSDASTGGAGVTGTIAGTGSSAQKAAIAAWSTKFTEANSGAKVNYDPQDSGAGRTGLINGSVAFAASDAPFKDEELTELKKKCTADLVEVPAYVSPIAIAYNLPGVDGLQLSNDTLAKIFTNKITKWNDPAIAKENSGANLPSTTITTVHRSDDSGTTKSFTDYLGQVAPKVWTTEADNLWPKGLKGNAAAKTDGVVAAIKGGEGSIGYADNSAVTGMQVAKLQTGSTYTAPSAEAVSAILDKAKQIEGRAKSDLGLEIVKNSNKDGLYSNVLVSYQMACSAQPDEATAATVKAWLTYVTSQDGQKVAAEAAGSAPLTEAWSKKNADAIAVIK